MVVRVQDIVEEIVSLDLDVRLIEPLQPVDSSLAVFSADVER